MKRSESERRQRPFYTVLRNGHRPPVLFLGFSIKSASWLPFVPVFPEGPPAPAHAHSLAEDWRTLQVGCRAAGRQAGMRADAACKGEGRLLLGGRWRWQGQCCTPLLAPQLVGRSVGRSATIGEGASKRAATLPHTFLAGGGVTFCTPLPPSSYRCNSSEFEEEEQRDGNRIGWAVKEGPRSHFGLEG